jgi:hypothetical protein
LNIKETVKLTKNLMPIHPNSVKLSVTIEGAELKKRVGVIFDAWDHTTRRERSFFDVPVKVFGGFVEDKLSKFT